MTNEEARRLYEEAVQRYDAKDFAGALEILDNLEASRPNSRHVIYHRALCLTELGRLREVLACKKKLEGRIDTKSLQRLSDSLFGVTTVQQMDTSSASEPTTTVPEIEEIKTPPPDIDLTKLSLAWEKVAAFDAVEVIPPPSDVDLTTLTSDVENESASDTVEITPPPSDIDLATLTSDVENESASDTVEITPPPSDIDLATLTSDVESEADSDTVEITPPPSDMEDTTLTLDVESEADSDTVEITAPSSDMEDTTLSSDVERMATEGIVTSEDTESAATGNAEDTAAISDLEDAIVAPPEDSENVFVVQSVYPVSIGECSVVGNVITGVFHVNNIANVVGGGGVLTPAPIMRIGTSDMPLLLAREGQRTVLVLRIDANEIRPGTAIICDTPKTKQKERREGAGKDASKATMLERPAELASVDKLIKQGAHSEAEHLLKTYTTQHPNSIVAKRMLAQIYLEPGSPLREPVKALQLIRAAYQSGGAEDPVVTNILAQAQAENGDPEMGLRFLERLYASTLEVEAKQALAQRIHDFRNKYGLGEIWEFADSYGEVIFESGNREEVVQAVVKGAVPLDAGCRRNHVGTFKPIETTLAPLFPEVAALFKPQPQQWSPGLVLLIILLIIGIILAWFIPGILKMMQ